MAELTNKQYLDLAGLKVYDGKIKGYVDNAVDTLDDAINGVNGTLTAEIANRQAGDKAINDKLGDLSGLSEDGKATVADLFGAAATALAEETTRAKAAEKANTDAIEAEVNRAKAAEKANADAIAAINNGESGVLASAKAYTDTKVGEEKTRAEGVEATLDAAIKAETSRATSAEGTLQSNIQSSLEDAKAYTDAEVTAEEDRAKAAEQAIQDVIGNTDNMPASTIIESINNEVVRATGAEESLGNRLTKVETFFETAEGEALDTALDTLVELQKYLDAEGKVADQMLLDIAANAKAIEDEAKRADAAEKANAKDIADLKAAVGEGGSVGAQIDAKINALDSTAAHTAGADGLALNVAIVDGKLTSISGSIAANTYDAHGSASTAETNAKSYTDTELAKVYAAMESIPSSEIEALFA